MRFLIFCLCLFSSLSASPLGNGEPPKQTEVPKPMDLKTYFWTYFEGEAPVVKKRLEEFQGVLEKSTQRLGEENLQAGVKSVNRFAIQSKRLFAERELEELPLSSPKESYTLEQLFSLRETIAKLEKDLDEAKKSLAFTAKRADVLEGLINDTFARYLSFEPETEDKLLRGLEIIEHKATLAVTEKEEAFLQSKVSKIQNAIDAFNKEFALARDRMDLKEWSKETLEAKLEEARTAYRKEKEALFQVEAAHVRKYEELLEDLNALAVSRQNLIASEIETAKKRVQIIKWEQIDNLVGQQRSWDSSFTVSQGRTDIKAIREKIEEWNSLIEEDQGLFDRVAEKNGSEATLVPLITSIKKNMQEIDLLEGEIKEVRLVISQVDKALAAKVPWWKVAYVKAAGVLTLVWGVVYEWSYKSLFTIGGIPITLLSLVKVILIFYFAVWVSRGLNKGLAHMIKRQSGASQASIYPLQVLMHYIVLIIAFFISLYSIGIDFSHLALVIGALTVGLGFGLQTILHDFLSGIFLLLEGCVRVSDYVELPSGEWGQVTSIGVQNTVIRTPNGEEIVLPNSEVNNQKITNWTLTIPYLRMHIPFGVAYGTDKEKVFDVVSKAALNVPCTATKKQGLEDPSVWLVGFGDSALNFELVVWVHVFSSGNHGNFTASYSWEIETALKEAGITIPFPQRDVHMIDPKSSKTPQKD